MTLIAPPSASLQTLAPAPYRWRCETTSTCDRSSWPPKRPLVLPAKMPENGLVGTRGAGRLRVLLQDIPKEHREDRGTMCGRGQAGREARDRPVNGGLSEKARS